LPAPNIIKIKGKAYEVLKIEKEIIKKDTIVYKKGQDIYHDTTIYVPYSVGERIDTAQILAAYNSKNVFSDTLILPDSLGSVQVTDTIQRNKILGRTYFASINKVKETVFVQEAPKLRAIMLGGAEYNERGSVFIGLQAETKKGFRYSLQVNQDGEFGLRITKKLLKIF
jgi:hypothetical protein